MGAKNRLMLIAFVDRDAGRGAGPAYHRRMKASCQISRGKVCQIRDRARARIFGYGKPTVDPIRAQYLIVPIFHPTIGGYLQLEQNFSWGNLRIFLGYLRCGSELLPGSWTVSGVS